MGRLTTHVLDTANGRPAAGVRLTLRAFGAAEAGRLFQELNGAYQQKFGFPFIMAVKHSNKDEILRAFAERLGNAPERELDQALEEIGRIAGYRLADIVEGGP